ncbi:hypothetical protein F7725_008779 [Dissostichus mawsoni]|uniref:Uncharacterized protein n=1 Tax=Dissostichus mawsoni TaxID=36200 RepID=A0A7J5Y845_DISMA|nr:hypothetical protein F7725_008779 [Dissostichus mawsoni]
MVAFSAFGQEQLIHLYLHDRTVSQLEGQSLKASSRSSSADPRTPPAPPLQDSMDQLILTTRLALKMQSVKQQLDSVLESPRSSLSGHNEPGAARELQSSGSASESSPVLQAAHASRTVSLQEDMSLQDAMRQSQLIKVVSLKPSMNLVPQRLLQACCWFQRTAFRSFSFTSPPLQVVSLYDYRASRSDELTRPRGRGPGPLQGQRELVVRTAV